MKISSLSKKQRIILIVIFFVLVAFPEIYLFIPYFLIIKPIGEKNINEIVSEVKTINQYDKQLERIVEWEANDFTELFSKDPNLNLYGLLGIYGLYFNASNPQPIKIRSNSIIFNNDPYWIAYFKSGACEERAHLFNFIANESDIISRVVRSPGNDHAWVEVYNGTEWIYADPTFYYHYHNFPGREKAWTGSTPILQEAWGWHLSTVMIESNETELTEKYTKIGNLSIIFNSSTIVLVNQFIPGEERNVTLFSKNTEDLQKRETVNYQLGLSNNYTVIAEKNNYNVFFKMIDEKYVLLNNESITIVLNPEKGREEINYPVVIATLIVIALYSIIFYWVYKRKKEAKRHRKTM